MKNQAFMINFADGKYSKSKTFGKDASITLWGGNGQAFGFTINPNMPFMSGGISNMISASFTRYLQLIPMNDNVKF